MSTLNAQRNESAVSTVELLYLDARIDNRQQLAYELRLSKFASDQEIVLAAYQRWQTDCARHFIGDFAFVIFDKRHQAYLMARDPFGCRTLFYYHHQGQLLFAKNMPSLLAQLSQKPDTNWQWLANTLTHSILMTTAYTDETYYQQVYRVTPGHSVVVAGKDKRSSAFWQPNEQHELNWGNDDEYVEAFKEHLNRAVYRRVKQADRLGCEISGGLDSSSVAVLAKQYQPELHGFSNTPHPDDPDKAKTDESAFARAVVQHAHIHPMHWMNATQDCDPASDFQLAVDLCAMPCEGLFPVSDMAAYRKAQQEGLHVMLSGFGGDQGVTVQGTTQMKDLALHGEWSALWHECHATQKTTYATYRQFVGLWLRRYFPGLMRLRDLKSSEVYDLADFALNENLRDKVNLPKRFPLLTYLRRQRSYTLREWQTQFFAGDSSWHIRARIESSAIIADHFGLQYAYPLLDQELLDFFISVPGHMKYQQGTRRYLMRQAMKGLLPDKVLHRMDKTGGTVPGMSYRLKQWISEQPALELPYAHSSHRLRAGDREGIERRQWFYLKMLQLMPES